MRGGVPGSGDDHASVVCFRHCSGTGRDHGRARSWGGPPVGRRGGAGLYKTGLCMPCVNVQCLFGVALVRRPGRVGLYVGGMGAAASTDKLCFGGVHRRRTCSTARRTAVAGRCGRCVYQGQAGGRPRCVPVALSDSTASGSSVATGDARGAHGRVVSPALCRPATVVTVAAVTAAAATTSAPRRPRACAPPPRTAGLRRAPHPFFRAPRGHRRRRWVSVPLRGRPPTLPPAPTPPVAAVGAAQRPPANPVRLVPSGAGGPPPTRGGPHKQTIKKTGAGGTRRARPAPTRPEATDRGAP